MTRRGWTSWLLAFACWQIPLTSSARPMAPVLQELGGEELAVGPRLRDRLEHEALTDDLLVDEKEVRETTAWLEARGLPPLEVTLEAPLAGRSKRGRTLLLTWIRSGLGSARWVSARQELEALVTGDGWSPEARDQMECLLDNARKLDTRIHARDPYAAWAVQLSRPAPRPPERPSGL